MSHLNARRRRRALPFLGFVLGIAVAACGGAAPSGPPASAAASNPGAAGSGDPGRAILIDDLLADPTAADGTVVRVTGNFLADEEHGARICALMMESYPPQCGGGSIRITGEVPAATLAKLSTTTEPGLDKAWWGYIVATGTFHATGAADGGPSLELGEIVLEEG